MRRRLQKKLHKGPFIEYGFELTAKLKETTGFDKFLDEYIDFIESHNISCGGGGSPAGFDSFIQVGTKFDAPEEKRLVVISWFENHPDVISCCAKQLVDAWK